MPDLDPVAFTGSGTLEAELAETLAVDFTGHGDLEAGPIVDELNLGVVDLTGAGYLDVTFPARGAGRRTVIVDADGNVIRALPEAGHGPITFELNRWEEGSFVAPIDEPAAAAVLADEFREVQLWRGDLLLLFGPMIRPSTDGKSLTVAVKGPLWHLSRRHVGKAERTNHVQNGDFEDGLAHWSPVVDILQNYYHWEGEQDDPPTVTLVRFPTVTGKRSLKAQNYVEGTGNQIQQQFEWTVDPSSNPEGDQWTCSGYFYVESFTAPAHDNTVIGFSRFSTTELDPSPEVQAANPGAKKQLQDASVRLDEDTPRNQWIPFSIDFTTPPKAGEPENLLIALRPPVGVVYFDRIRVTRVESTSWWGVDQNTIVKDLVAHAQDPAYGKDDVNLTYRDLPTGVLRDLELVHHEHPNIWSELIKLTELADGFDIDCAVTPRNRQVRTYSPAKGRHVESLALRLGSNVGGFAWSFEGDNASSAIIVLGTGDGSAREETSAIDPTAFSGGLTLEEVFSAPIDTRIEMLDKIGAERLAVTKAPETLAVRTMAHSPTVRSRNMIGRLWPGDTVPVNLRVGVLSIVGTYRVSRMTINPDDTLDLVLGRRTLFLTGVVA